VQNSDALLLSCLRVYFLTLPFITVAGVPQVVTPGLPLNLLVNSLFVVGAEAPYGSYIRLLTIESKGASLYPQSGTGFERCFIALSAPPQTISNI
jgi:hypothetical protein